MKNLKYLLFLALIINSLNLFSQSKNVKNKGIIKGIIVEKDQQTSISYATISIFKTLDNQLITGSISDEKGAFKIAIPYGDYTAIIESIAFQKKAIVNIIVQKTSPEIDLGTLILENSIVELTEVAVTAQKSEWQFGVAQKIFTVGKDITAAGGSVVDILDNIPSVTVDPQGRVNLRGSQSVNILIDSKPSAMTKGELLKNIQANTVDKIALITNPSAKFDAEGLTGIINIVLKKDKKIGTSGSLNIAASTPHDYNLGLSLKRRIRQFSWFMNLGIRHWQRPRNGYQESTFSLNDSTFTIRKEQEQIRRSFSANINAGLDYFINKKSHLTASLLYNIGKQPHDSEIFYQYSNNDNQLTNNELRLNNELEIESSLEYLISYEKTFSKKKQKLTAFIKYIDYIEKNDSDLTEFRTDVHKMALDLSLLEQRTRVEEKDKNWLFQMDYEHPFNQQFNGEFGLKASNHNIQNNFLVETFGDQKWITLEGLSNDFSYDEKVYAAYGLINFKKDGLSYQLGLRGELTQLETALEQTNEINKRQPFFNLFPSANLSYRFNNSHSFQLSYSRRIQRPQFHHLNPFFSYSDDRFISIGNPNLNPMFTNILEIGHLKSYDKTSISSAIYHRRTKNLIENFVFVDEEGITFTQPQNLNKAIITGVEFFIEKSLTKWWKCSGSLDGFYRKIDGDNLSSNLLTTYYAWNGRINNKFRLPKSIQVQIKYFYQGAEKTILGKRKPLSRFDIALKKRILEGKGNLSLSCMDLFNTYKFRYTEQAEGIQTIAFYQPWQRTIRLGFQYRWK